MCSARKPSVAYFRLGPEEARCPGPGGMSLSVKRLPLPRPLPSLLPLPLLELPDRLCDWLCVFRASCGGLPRLRLLPRPSGARFGLLVPGPLLDPPPLEVFARRMPPLMKTYPAPMENLWSSSYASKLVMNAAQPWRMTNFQSFFECPLRDFSSERYDLICVTFNEPVRPLFRVNRDPGKQSGSNALNESWSSTDMLPRLSAASRGKMV